MSGQKILVVDDSWTELTMIVTPLRNSGFDVVTAVDGDEAVEKVLRERPRVLFLMLSCQNKMDFRYVANSKVQRPADIFLSFC